MSETASTSFAERRLDRRRFLQVGAAAGATAYAAGRLAGLARAAPGGPIEEATIAQLQADMAAGRLTAAKLVHTYLDRIDAIDRHGPAINSIIETNPDAEQIAKDLGRRPQTSCRTHVPPLRSISSRARVTISSWRSSTSSGSSMSRIS
jgi:hypothetical protein